MICLGKHELNDEAKLLERKEYVLKLLGKGRRNASPSSQEWESSEHFGHHQSMLREEIDEINARLKHIQKVSVRVARKESK